MARRAPGYDRNVSVRLSARTAGRIVFLALVTVCGIAVHLVSELASLGWRGDADLIVSPRHIPLAILATIAFVGLGAVGVRTASAFFICPICAVSECEAVSSKNRRGG